MSSDNNHRDYRIQELERKVAGMQRQISIVNARLEGTTQKQDRRVRDLEIKVAVRQGGPAEEAGKNLRNHSQSRKPDCQKDCLIVNPSREGAVFTAPFFTCLQSLAYKCVLRGRFVAASDAGFALF